MTERARLLEVLPFYLNGTLEAAERAWVDAYLTQHPELRSQLDFQHTVREHVIDAAERSVQQVSNTVGLAQTLERIRAIRLRDRWIDWLFGTCTATGWRIAPAFIAALLVIGVQSVLLMQQSERRNPHSVRSIGRSLADGPLLRVNFKPEAREADIRLLMIEAHALIVAGPTRLGDYYLKVGTERLPATRGLIAASALVQQVDEVPGLPEEVLE